MAGKKHTFLERVANLETSREADPPFDRMVKRSAISADPGLYPRLFDALVGHLLVWYGLPASKSAAQWEWAPLYRLEREIDPHYFVQRQISDRLAECPPLDPERSKAISGILAAYFRWRRQGLRSTGPEPLVSLQDCENWCAIFPSSMAWQALDVLRAVGLYPLGSAAAYRAHRRFSDGAFTPDYSPSTLRQWQAECVALSEITGLEAHRYDFMAAAFAEEFHPLGLEGTCGEIPRCDVCLLRRHCAWAASEHHSDAGPLELLAQVRRGGLQDLPTGALLRVFLEPLDGAQGIEQFLESGSLRRLADRTLAELEELVGREGGRPERLKVLFEICRRFNEDRIVAGDTIRGAADVFAHFRIRMRDIKQEQFFLIMLDAKRRLLGEVTVSQGTLDHTPVHPRDVYAPAIRERASSVLIVHNHPTGDPTPSKDDINVTKRLVDAGAVIGIPLLDHVIIGEERYFSLSENGLMNF